MSNGDGPAPKTNSTGNNGGMGSILTTLAKGGDKYVQMLIVAGILVNGFMTKCNSNSINNNSSNIAQNTRELEALRNTAFNQLGVIYDNQRVFAAFMDETRFALDRIQNKEAIPHPSITPYPQQEIPEYILPYPPQPREKNND